MLTKTPSITRSKLIYFLLSCFVCLLSLTGCSSGRRAPILSTFECDSELVQSELIPKSNNTDPQVTKLTVRGQTVFATTIIECDVRDYVPTRATSRQLLSGFENLNIKSEGYVDKNNSSDHKTVYVIFGSAEIDKRPIEVMAASSRSQECVTDSVFWRQRSEITSTPLNDLIMPIIECVK